jgi:hypothetical protein
MEIYNNSRKKDEEEGREKWRRIRRQKSSRIFMRI